MCNNKYTLSSVPYIPQLSEMQMCTHSYELRGDPGFPAGHVISVHRLRR